MSIPVVSTPFSLKDLTSHGSAVNSGYTDIYSKSDGLYIKTGSSETKIVRLSDIAGQIVNVYYVEKTDTFTTTSTTFTDITDLSLAITPISTSSTFIFFMNCSVGGGNGIDTNHVGLRMARDGSPIHIGDTRGDRMPATNVFNYGRAGQMFHGNGVYLDSPATTSEITYSAQLKTTNGAYTACCNRSGRDSDNAVGFDGTGASSLLVLEVA